MSRSTNLGYALSGGIAGLVAGLLGTGGGMILIPLLQFSVKPNEDALFPTSVYIMLPLCLVTLCAEAMSRGGLPFSMAWPYMAGGATGGVLAGILAKRIPTLWLHRGLGALIIWGGVRYLC